MVNFGRYGHGAHKVLGLHGWFGDADTFSALEQSLDPDHFECAWLAHRGYGRSSHITGRYDMHEMAEDALAVADRLEWPRFSIIGHSMGGKAAQLLAAGNNKRVRTLTCISSVSADPVPFDADTRALFERATEDEDVRRLIIGISVANRLSPIWVERLAALSVARSRRDAFAAYFKSWADEDLSSTIDRLEVPTLVLVGAHDPIITASYSEAGFGQRFSVLTVKTLENSGHYAMDEVPLALGAELLAHLQEGSVGA